MFDLRRFIQDVFAPEPGESALVIADMPHGHVQDNPDWADRRAWATEWQEAFAALGVQTSPVVLYPATGANNGELPAQGSQNGREINLPAMIGKASIVAALNRYSATAPLSRMTQRHPGLRVASMPGILRRMEQTALSADVNQVARKAIRLQEKLQLAESALWEFDTGHQCRFDLRYREAHADDGLCRRDKQGFRLINIPSGEAFIVPYEGERDGDPSRTEGTIPMIWKDTLILFHVDANRIVAIEGKDPVRSELQAHFDLDPARRNIAEVGLGCNDRAMITGVVLEDEKAGPHWAYGRSEHLGGTVGPGAFSSPDHVIHQDIVYAKGCPIGLTRLTLFDATGAPEVILRDQAYVIP
ncbi:MAG: hypothetical protein KDL31_00875 [Kiritimatiellae bacterium]|nr:hypothetical protein [Kiritimatiellia bacterium]